MMAMTALMLSKIAERFLPAMAGYRKGDSSEESSTLGRKSQIRAGRGGPPPPKKEIDDITGINKSLAGRCLAPFMLGIYYKI